MKPLFDNILVEELKPDQKTPGGLHLPDNCSHLTSRFKVIEAGSSGKPDSAKDPRIIAGRTIIAFRTAGVEIDHEGTKVRILRPEECLAIV